MSQKRYNILMSVVVLLVLGGVISGIVVTLRIINSGHIDPFPIDHTVEAAGPTPGFEPAALNVSLRKHTLVEFRNRTDQRHSWVLVDGDEATARQVVERARTPARPPAGAG